MNNGIPSNKFNVIVMNEQGEEKLCYIEIDIAKVQAILLMMEDSDSPLKCEIIPVYQADIKEM